MLCCVLPVPLCYQVSILFYFKSLVITMEVTEIKLTEDDLFSLDQYVDRLISTDEIFKKDGVLIVSSRQLLITLNLRLRVAFLFLLIRMYLNLSN